MIIDEAKRRRFLAMVGEQAKEMIYDETLAGYFTNGGPFQYRNKKYEDKKRQAGRFRGYVDFFGFSHPNTINTMMTDVDTDRFQITIRGDSVEKTLKWRSSYNWFSFGGSRQEKVDQIAIKTLKTFDWS